MSISLTADEFADSASISSRDTNRAINIQRAFLTQEHRLCLAPAEA
jgi:hypothetical protein